MSRIHVSDEVRVRMLTGCRFESNGCARAGDAGWMKFHRDVIAEGFAIAGPSSGP